jgi:uncharacterized protein involved in response to NO
MMARVSLGHTGRALVPAGAMTAAFLAIQAAAVARVLGALVVAGALWTLAFAAFLAIYTPILAAPRVDGKPG